MKTMKNKEKEYDLPRIEISTMMVSEFCLATSGNILLGEGGDGIHVDEIIWE